MTATLLVLAGSTTEELVYPPWQMIPGGYVRTFGRRVHQAATPDGVYIRGLGSTGERHEITLRYIPADGPGGSWHAPIDRLVVLEGEEISVSWGGAQLPGRYMLESVQATYRETLYVPDVGSSRGGWAARVTDVRMTLRGGPSESVAIDGVDSS